MLRAVSLWIFSLFFLPDVENGSCCGFWAANIFIEKIWICWYIGWYCNFSLLLRLFSWGWLNLPIVLESLGGCFFLSMEWNFTCGAEHCSIKFHIQKGSKHQCITEMLKYPFVYIFTDCIYCSLKHKETKILPLLAIFCPILNIYLLLILFVEY